MTWVLKKVVGVDNDRFLSQFLRYDAIHVIQLFESNLTGIKMVPT